jgi:hypothetical protein
MPSVGSNVSTFSRIGSISPAILFPTSRASTHVEQVGVPSTSRSDHNYRTTTTLTTVSKRRVTLKPLKKTPNVLPHHQKAGVLHLHRPHAVEAVEPRVDRDA